MKNWLRSRLETPMGRALLVLQTGQNWCRRQKISSIFLFLAGKVIFPISGNVYRSINSVIYLLVELKIEYFVKVCIWIIYYYNIVRLAHRGGTFIVSLSSFILKEYVVM